MPLSETTIRRLSFVRYLYEVAVEQSRISEPFGASALLGFHDAAELFLQIAAELHNAGAARLDFMEYFDYLDKSIAPEVTSQRESMRRLNKARVALKHHGTFPSRLDVEDYRAFVTLFFEENSPKLLGIKFDDISLSDLVNEPTAREYLSKAELDLANSRTEDAMYNIAIAFAYLRRSYGVPESRSRALHNRARDFEISLGYNDGRPTVLRELADAVAVLQDEVSILRYGLDPLRLAIFDRLAGSAAISMSGQPRVSRMGRGRETNLSEARFCYEFAISSALKMQQVAALSAEVELPLHLLALRRW